MANPILDVLLALAKFKIKQTLKMNRPRSICRMWPAEGDDIKLKDFHFLSVKYPPITLTSG